jgi:hypothetical protein
MSYLSNNESSESNNSEYEYDYEYSVNSSQEEEEDSDQNQTKESEESEEYEYQDMDHRILGSNTSTINTNQNSVNNMGKLFAKLNLQLKNMSQTKTNTNTQNPTQMQLDPQMSLIPKTTMIPDPPKPLLVITNREHLCYDCAEIIKIDDDQGTGFGFLGINLYFCRQCYLTRFAGGEGEIIDFSEGIDTLLLEQYRQEFTYKINHPKNCFDCSLGYNINNVNKFKSCKGLLGNILVVCNNCQFRFQQRITHLKEEYTNQYNKFLTDELHYYIKQDKYYNQNQNQNQNNST